jgi:hypothetical protein
MGKIFRWNRMLAGMWRNGNSYILIMGM